MMTSNNIKANMSYEIKTTPVIIDKNTKEEANNIRSYIKDITLMKYQRQTIHYMMEKERTFNDCFIENHKRYRSKIGILSNTVGSGKTFCSLNLICNKEEVVPYEKRKWIYFNESLYDNTDLPKDIVNLIGEYTEERENIFVDNPEYEENKNIMHTKCNLIIVPHNIVNQWEIDIKNIQKENFKYMIIKTVKDTRKFFKSCPTLDDYDVILINNNQKKNFCSYFEDNIVWNRILLDEPDKLKRQIMDNMYCNFLWLITATPTSMDFYNIFAHSYDLGYIDDKYIRNGITCSEKYIRTFFKLEKPLLNQQTLAVGKFELFMACFNKRFVINNQCIFYTLLAKIIRCANFDRTFKRKTFNLMPGPTLGEVNYWNLYDRFENLKNMDMKINTLLNSLCFFVEDEYANYRFVNMNRYEKNDIGFVLVIIRTVLKYYYPLINQDTEIYEDKLSTLEEFFIYKNERKFEVDFRLNFFTMKNQIIEADKKTKIEKVLDIVENNINNNGERLLFFSNNNRIFNDKDIKNRELKGNATTINRIMRDFESGKIKILMLNSQHYGAGINLQMADRLIILDNVHENDYKQVVGRAQRIGRKTRLKIDYYTDEYEKMCSDIKYTMMNDY
jgi:hypothetical protein